MSKLILLDFKCKGCQRTEEHLVAGWTQRILCKYCGAFTHRVISGTNFKLDGTDPAFPTAWDKWATQHEKAGGQDEPVSS